MPCDHSDDKIIGAHKPCGALLYRFFCRCGVPVDCPKNPAKVLRSLTGGRY